MNADTGQKLSTDEPVPDPVHGFTEPAVDAIAKAGLDWLERVLTRVEDLQRQTADEAWGPGGPPDLHRLAAICAIAQTTIARLADEHIDAVAERVRAGVPPPQAPGYVGWHRQGRGSRWRAVVRGDSEDEVFAMLLVAVAGGDKLVLASGDDPNLRPKPR